MTATKICAQVISPVGAATMDMLMPAKSTKSALPAQCLRAFNPV
jgi:hypothetical protein